MFIISDNILTINMYKYVLYLAFNFSIYFFYNIFFAQII